MSSIRPLIPLLIAAGILLGGNGLQGTLIALRGAREGFSASDIGLMGTFYFAGFLLGCLAVTRILKAVGHVRAFAALAAIASVGTLLLVLVINPVMWCAVRFAGGFCFAGLFTVMEAWLNSGVTNKDRARVLAIYRMVDIGSVTGAQFLIPIFGAGGFAIFAVMSMMITFSLVPVSLGDRSNPAPPEDVKLDLPRVWRISPLGSIGCIAVGVTNSAFRTLSPVYAEEIGMSVADVVTFVSVGIFGGALIQYPLGYLSDRRDRRTVLLATTCCAMLAALALAFVARADPFLNFVIVFIFGSFAMPLYSLSAAHANDRAGKGEFVLINAALMLFYSFGAIGGPIAASAVMQHFGPSALFVFNACVYAVLIVVILYRMQVRSGVPAGSRSRFTALLRTSTLFARLARRSGDSDRQG
ncbi:MFS transporter [Mesorhizobium sp. M1C.F.Ca.ET.193.01.1.1]|uniref:MFS transporter n=1 Tax=unclassified Mesorhizobium TaxID=325217 RepID=UPI000FD5989D|nr:MULTISPECIES: MFS transporter [unclassified Mesorhizobium]TGT00294.1 MFS transporter [bacterium M00.F.Ca.ET.177.01.1.1]TGQ53699.1 MFS transporter [Mesorhizobium sp. M1C.F.Ca.ET.210.01.1.1]TGQ71731.1 MFS transporter [Mesorhizobium sp. M1C.F.Ca.ET.212.01.1.1]TGR08473.1 MFS transporter [Mesorhizobium sp. M1C.F.Ca.ET.204.01.1.1]TGR28713.1 MFS transporter [Mesorhizobium sp. M1C.F.Ca.ET.196.01.1.1]